uniref:DinB/UmuC family translesion DNA polymerase n=1 Tax=Marivivens donghaensis TaxID=1699413 RepID=UPI003F696B8B
QASLDKAGIHTIGDLHRWEKDQLTERFGQTGERLFHLARGEDFRRISPNAPVKSISKETTFFEDTSDPDVLDGHLWRLSEQVSARAKAKDKAGRVVTLKLKTKTFKTITKRQSLHQPTQMADTIYRVARSLYDAAGNTGPFRLIGVGISDLTSAHDADREGDLLDPDAGRRANAERAADKIRAKFGNDAIKKGRALR